MAPLLAGWHYLDPQEDAEIPWWGVQDGIGQLAASGTPGLPVLLALAIIVGTEHAIITPLLGTREGHNWAFQEESNGLPDFNHIDGCLPETRGNGTGLTIGRCGISRARLKRPMLFYIMPLQQGLPVKSGAMQREWMPCPKPWQRSIFVQEGRWANFKVRKWTVR